MSDEIYDILKTAVNIARNERVKRLANLKERLLEKYPGKEVGIDQALEFWASRVDQPA